MTHNKWLRVPCKPERARRPNLATDSPSRRAGDPAWIVHTGGRHTDAKGGVRVGLPIQEGSPGAAGLQTKANRTIYVTEQGGILRGTGHREGEERGRGRGGVAPRIEESWGIAISKFGSNPLSAEG